MTPFKILWKLLKWWWSLDWRVRVGSLVALVVGIGCTFAYFSGLLSWSYWTGASSFGNYTTKTNTSKASTVKTLDAYKNVKGIQLKMEDIQARVSEKVAAQSGFDKDESGSELDDAGSNEDEPGSDFDGSDSDSGTSESENEN